MLPSGKLAQTAGPPQEVGGRSHAVEGGEPVPGVELVDQVAEVMIDASPAHRHLLQPDAQLLGLGGAQLNRTRVPGTQLHRTRLHSTWCSRRIAVPLGTDWDADTTARRHADDVINWIRIKA